MRLTSNGIDFGSMAPARRLSFITLALTRSRCARDLNTIHENTTVSPRLSGIRRGNVTDALPVLEGALRGRGDSVVDRLIGCRPEIATDIRRTGRGPGALGHQEADHVLPGIRAPGGAQAAVPSELSDGPGHVVAPGDHGQTEPPAVAIEIAPAQTGRRLLLGRELIGRHGLDRRPGQDALAPMPARVQHHPTEGEVVIDGRDETAGGGRERGRAAPLAALGLVVDLE